MLWDPIVVPVLMPLLIALTLFDQFVQLDTNVGGGRRAFRSVYKNAVLDAVHHVGHAAGRRVVTGTERSAAVNS